MLKLPANLHKPAALLLIILLLANLVLFGARKISGLLFWITLGLVGAAYFVFFRKKK